jgi:prepilin-type N-terminal cleavage/methylation domain-containing protein
MFKNGFTLIELVIVLAIIAILSAIVVTGFSSFRNAQAFDRDVEMIVSFLNEARTQTLSSKNASAYGVHFASTAATLFTAPTYTSGAEGNKEYVFLGHDTMLTLSLTGGANEIVFERLTGETDQNGTIVVSSAASGRTKTITIHETGLVE